MQAIFKNAPSRNHRLRFYFNFFLFLHAAGKSTTYILAICRYQSFSLWFICKGSCKAVYAHCQGLNAFSQKGSLELRDLILARWRHKRRNGGRHRSSISSLYPRRASGRRLPRSAGGSVFTPPPPLTRHLGYVATCGRRRSKAHQKSLGK